jgi:hypothetical protein
MKSSFPEMNTNSAIALLLYNVGCQLRQFPDWEKDGFRIAHWEPAIKGKHVVFRVTVERPFEEGLQTIVHSTVEGDIDDPSVLRRYSTDDVLSLNEYIAGVVAEGSVVEQCNPSDLDPCLIDRMYDECFEVGRKLAPYANPFGEWPFSGQICAVLDTPLRFEMGASHGLKLRVGIFWVNDETGEEAEIGPVWGRIEIEPPGDHRQLMADVLDRWRKSKLDDPTSFWGFDNPEFKYTREGVPDAR